MKLPLKWAIFAAFLGIASFIPRQQNTPGYSSAHFFRLNTRVGERIGNIFSRAISYKSADFPEIVRRVSGTGIYTVVGNDPSAPVFDGLFRYDGRPESRSKVEISEN